MKEQKRTVPIKEDKSRTARRRARAAIGAVQPARIITPKPLKPPRHKRNPLGEDPA